MVKAGFSPRDVLLAATRDAAKVFSTKPEIGTITPGARADLEGFLRLYADDAAIADHPSGENKRTGKEELRRVYGKLFADNPALQIKILSRAVHGPFVVDQELVTGIEKRKYIHGVALYEVRDGLIRRVWFLRKP